MQFKKVKKGKSLSSLESWILLSKLSSFGYPEAKKIIEEFGLPEKVFNLPLEKLCKVSKIDKKVIDFIKRNILEGSLQREKKVIERLNVEILPLTSPLYPERLRSITAPPLVLYIRGRLKKEDSLAVAIVGTRRATSYGKVAARKLARELAREGVTVVSGMARGIDTCAHEGALEEGGRTIAVLGCGVDVVYPPENSSLMEEIIKNGAVVSEFCPGTKPYAGNFPRRNRIISGLSMGVVVVEAPLKSGALITVEFALEQGKEVFAVPGHITSPYSEGTNRLIKEGAKVVQEVEDILEELGIEKKNGRSFSQRFQLTFEERKVLDNLDLNPVHIDRIAERCNFSVAKTCDLLMRLQLKGMVRELPGKLFLRED
ncbi:DNA-protecting protein DprA [Candidatus Aerophobetes bacterium]|nr:DNA-protecting protein DprA [Candidatus Aerophobetes bacterium]